MPFRGSVSHGCLRSYSSFFLSLFLVAALQAVMPAATPDRIVGKIDSSRMRRIGGNVHHLAQAKYDQGEADPGTPMNYMVMLLEPSPAQRGDLAQLLVDQQNPALPQYHKWLAPEVFGERFGLSHADLSKISAWLKGEGFSIDRQARGGNWIAFSGTAAQTSRTFHATIHRYSINGESHFANASDPQVPEALAGIVT